MIILKCKFNNDCKIFANEIEDTCYPLIQNILDNKVSYGVPIRIMPDVHSGKGIVIGFTMPLTDRINPEHVGVDIGCGVLTAKLNGIDDLIIKFGNDIKHVMNMFDNTIRENIPMGFEIHEDKTYILDTLEINRRVRDFYSKWKNKYVDYGCPEINEEYLYNLFKKININKKQVLNSVGTLGGGNHYIEIGKDTKNNFFITIHSGSRSLGKKVCDYYAKLSKKTIDHEEFLKGREFILKNAPKEQIGVKINELIKTLNDNLDTSYLKDENMFMYCIDLVIYQYYAEINREEILNIISKTCNLKIDYKFDTIHNYIDFDEYIIRKGTISAKKNEKCAIPMNMRDGLLLCIGKGNLDWNNSAPHGSGRILSRGVAKNVLSLEEFKNEMADVYSSSVNYNNLDESPMAYKNSEVLKTIIEPTVDILGLIKPCLNIKSNN